MSWEILASSIRNQVNDINGGQNLETDASRMINTGIYAAGIIAVIVIIIGGINYTISRGDPSKVKKAKDTIMYGIIGLVIVALAWTITWFVTTKI
jgi:hypothetical protein